MELATMLLHNQLGLACLLIDFALCRNPFDEVFILDIAWAVANNRNIVLFPFGDLGLLFHFRAIGEEDFRSEFDCEGLERLNRFGAEEFLVLFKRAPFIANDVERAVFVEGNPMPFFVLTVRRSV